MTRVSQAGKGASSKGGGHNKGGGKKGGKSKFSGKADTGSAEQPLETVSLTRSQNKWKKFREKQKSKKSAEKGDGKDADRGGEDGAGVRGGASSSPAFTPVHGLPTPPVPTAEAVRDDSGQWVDKSFPPKPWVGRSDGDSSRGKARDDTGGKKGKGKSKQSKFGKGKWKTKNR